MAAQIPTATAGTVDPPASANYQQAEPTAEAACATCQFFDARPSETADGWCRFYDADVLADYVSDGYEPADAAAAQVQLAEGQMTFGGFDLGLPAKAAFQPEPDPLAAAQARRRARLGGAR